MELIQKNRTRTVTGNQDNNARRVPAALGEHGGNIYKIAQELGISEKNLVDFSASINPLGISDRVRDVIKQELDGLVNYPDPDTRKLKEAIAMHHGIDSETVICGNGSTELIYLIPRALKPSKVLVSSPSFSEYERACTLNRELRITNYELRKEDGFRIAPDGFGEAIRGCDMAFLCNPNNPTGGLLKKDDVLAIAEAAEREKCFLVVDEAFIDYDPGESVIGSVEDFSYLIVLRSMTKFYALTGLRIGYGVVNKEMLARINEYKEPWTVNHLAQTAAVAALEDEAYAARTMDMIQEEKRYVEKRFHEVGIEFIPSAANYYLLKIKDAESAVIELRKKGILVRDCSNFRGLDNSYIRVAVKSREQNEMLIKEMAGL